jgi:gliding motility-associated-like protein
LKTQFFIVWFLMSLASLEINAQNGSSNLEFIENKGQWDKSILFKGELNNGAFYIQRSGFTVLLYNGDDLQSLRHSHAASGSKNLVPPTAAKGTPPTLSLAAQKPVNRIVHAHGYTVSFDASNPAIEVLPDKPLPSYNNYFIGNDPARWASRCKIFQGITYKNIYPHIDVRYYSNNGQVKYDIIVHPGGDISRLALKYAGVGKLGLHANKLQIHTSVGEVQELVPVCYELDASGKNEINCKYVLTGDSTVRFSVKNYSSTSTLIIDPTLVFCSFTGSKSSNWGFTATPGPDGSFFAGGIVFGDGFPVSPGASQMSFTGGLIDVGIIKFNPTGSNRVYATYLGGSSDETPHSLISDPQGDLIILGRTFSADFPTLNKVGPGGLADMFVVKLSPGGDQLLGSMVIGGRENDCVNIEDQFESDHEVAESLIKNYGDDSRSEVILDAANNIYVAASTQSTNQDSFPIIGPVFQPNFGGGAQDGVVLKIDPTCKTVLWSSYLGGSDADAAFVLKVNPITGDLYVAGATSSLDFPGDRTGVMQPAYQGGLADGFVTILSSDGTTQRKTTYLGTNGFDAVYGLGFDKTGFPYVMGSTTGNWPVLNVAYVNAGAKQYISKLRPDLSGFVYSTTFGKAAPSPNISPVAFLVDRCENVYATGWGGWIFAETDPYGLSGTIGMPVTPNAIKSTTDGRDFYFIVLKKNASSLLYGTFYGQTDGAQSVSEHVDGGTSRYDENGVIYQAICGNCGDHSITPFPTTPGVWSPFNGTGGVGCNLAAVKIAFDFAGVAAELRSYINGVLDSSGCAPLNVLLSDTIRNAKNYIWDFGDSSPRDTTTSYELYHLYSNPGTYRVMLIAIDSNTCNVSDTVYLDIRARTDSAGLQFNATKIPPCDSLTYLFTNVSTPPAGKPFTDSSFIWNFGDGQRQRPGQDSVLHTFLSPGTYTISLVLNDTNYCNFPDSASLTLRIASLVKAQFLVPNSGCVPDTAVFNNTSLGGQQFSWDFGDMTTSTQVSPTHVYTQVGTYIVRLSVIDSNTCNITSSYTDTIVVHDRPVASFTYGPIPPVANMPIVFTNTSTGAFSYLWYFGDGDSATQKTLDTIAHLYESTGTFRACLVAINQFGCASDTCQNVQTLVNPLLDVPNAFTPGRFGQNSVIKVAGYGITTMIWKIYNRWGQVVFETNDPTQGWDGNFRGNPEPMDVYAYTLTAIFSDGTKTTKSGDITLIR